MCIFTVIAFFCKDQPFWSKWHISPFLTRVTSGYLCNDSQGCVEKRGDTEVYAGIYASIFRKDSLVSVCSPGYLRGLMFVCGLLKFFMPIIYIVGAYESIFIDLH